ILEIGCGNARNLIPFAKNGFECYGVDFSKNMLKKAKEYVQKNNVKIKLIRADMLRLPFKDREFDYVLSVASLHHVTDDKDSKKALSEMNRVLKKKGILLLTVWNKLQLRFLFRRKNIRMPWKIGDKVYFRNVHLFDYFELKKFVRKTGFGILESNIFGKNLVFVLRK
ncbi:MAG: class I SAM-dependent methyltransferase, partial [Nanoarchaeota archaeon]